MKRGVGSEWPAETLTSTTPALTLSMDDAGEPMASLAGGLLIPPIIPEIDDNLEIDTTGLSGLSLLTEVLLDPDANATNATLNSNSSTTSLLPAFGHSIPHILSPLEIPDLPHISPFGDGDGEPGEKDDGGMAETVAPETSGAPIALEAAEGPDTPQQEHDTVEMEQMEQIGETSQTIPVEIPPELQAEAKPGDIAAYFALEFLDMQYIYYLQRSTVSLGRGAIPGATGQESSSSSSADIDLGPLKNISRLHARIEYEEESERFVLVVIGRNGVFVDGVWIEPGRRVPLCDR